MPSSIGHANIERRWLLPVPRRALRVKMELKECSDALTASMAQQELFLDVRPCYLRFPR
ncbi:hypothetical protein AGR7B_Lc110019 [Agrobacterium deltaense RV3]|nr:hypothetical protein AGR7B_Lc110019 [Agrobacterium deltaense RV3]